MRITLRSAGAVLATVALALPAAAQNTQSAPAARPDPPQQDRPAAERPAAGTQDAGQPQRQAQQPAQRPDPAQPNGVPSKDEVMKRLASEEAKHRETVAKIDRLRELAQQKGNTERQSRLADMLKRENDRYAALRAKARAALGDDTFKAMERRLAQGRGRGPAAGDQAAGRAAQQKPDAGQPARKPDQPQQRPAPQRPAAPKADSDAKPAAPPDRPKSNANNRKAQANSGTQQPAAGSQRGSTPK
ncbi:MAG TPA: hypothetical protein VFY71_17265 [Planctomycetota bacterium]|nr:hypothetical protein [Planctomycetota bacterium]